MVSLGWRNGKRLLTGGIMTMIVMSMVFDDDQDGSPLTIPSDNEPPSDAIKVDSVRRRPPR